ncbi:hypothetical protein [Faucicola atlantae]|nr:hypothetical protein [Moraxella atlantae]
MQCCPRKIRTKKSQVLTVVGCAKRYKPTTKQVSTGAPNFV